MDSTGSRLILRVGGGGGETLISMKRILIIQWDCYLAEYWSQWIDGCGICPFVVMPLESGDISQGLVII